MRRPTPPPTMRWCVGPAGVLYEQALIALRGVLEAASEQHWLRWIDDDIDAWRTEGSTRHHRSAYGGMGSLNDLYLARAQDEPDRIWLDAALDTLRHIAASTAPFAEQSSSALRQIAPGASTTSLAGLPISVCGECNRRYVSPEARLYAAAAAWCSAAVPELAQARRGAEVAPRSVGLGPGDDRHQYVDFVDVVVGTEQLQPAVHEKYADWFCPRCAHRRWRASSVAVFGAPDTRTHTPGASVW
jgi:hypothetical protein